MKHTVHLFGLVSVFALTLTAACSSDSGGGTTSTGGTTGTTGGTAGTTSGTGGSSGSTAATGGNAGTSSGACTAAAAALISDFSGTGGLVSSDPYAGADTHGSMTPTFDTTSGSLVIAVATGATTEQYPYAFVGMGLDTCTDASAYTSVSFMASGTLDCPIQFSLVDKEHNAVGNGGTCTTGCYAGGSIFTLPATPTAVVLTFAAQPQGGTDVAGAAALDPTQILAIQWQVNPPATGCTGTVTIDDVTFQ